jgi:hypothetical protein
VLNVSDPVHKAGLQAVDILFEHCDDSETLAFARKRSWWFVDEVKQ